MCFQPARPVRAQGANIFVSRDGTGTDCSQAVPCLPSQGLIKAVEGDTIYFKYGPYTDVLSDPYMTIEKAVSLIGGWDGAATGDIVIDPDFYGTIIDGGHARALFVINDSSGALITVSGFTFQGGSSEDFGGAIQIISGRVDILDSVFRENYAGSYGGAIEVEPAFDIRILGNYFEDNEVDYGGGSIYVGSDESTVTLIEDNTFSGGTAQYGSAITNWSSKMIINRNTFIDNLGVSTIRLSSPGPISTISNNFFIRPEYNAIVSSEMPEGNSPHQIINNTIAGAGYGILVQNGSALNVVNNIITGTSQSIAVLGGGLLTGSNNLFYDNTEDPNPLIDSIVANPDYLNTADDNYHISEDSPAVNAGTSVMLDEDFDGEYRPSGGRFDIGADEIKNGVLIFTPLFFH